MNIVKAIIAKQIENRGNNKAFPCATYATEAAAEKATAAAAQEVKNAFDSRGHLPVGYLVIYVEAWGKWIGAINLTEAMHRAGSHGGYLGVAPRFYKF